MQSWRKIRMLLAAGAVLGVAAADEAPLEAENFIVNRGQAMVDRLEPGKWNIWSKDHDALKKWSGGVVLQSNPVMADRKVEEAAILQFKLPVKGDAPVNVRGKVGRLIGISTDGGKNWKKCGDGVLATRLQPRDGFVEFWAADLFATPQSPGSAYLDYFIIEPANAPKINNAGFEQGKPGETPSGWSKIWKRDAASHAAANLSSDAADGKMAVRITTAMEKDWAFSNHSRFAVEPDDQYLLSCRAKNLGDTPAAISLQLVGTDAAGKLLRYDLGVVGLKPVKDQWQVFSGTITIPAGVTHGFIRLIGSGNADVLVDDIQCQYTGKKRPQSVFRQVQGFAKERVAEKLDRGLIAVPTPRGSYLGWRLLPGDAPDLAFDLYRVEAGREVKLNGAPLRQTTDFFAPAAPEHTVFRVKAAGADTVLGEAALAPKRGTANPYRSYRLPDREAMIGKVGIGDLDGDGRYDFVVRTPRANVDPWRDFWKKSADTFKLTALNHDGRVLWERDLGWSIERGIWYAPFVVYDVNGDGRAEVILKVGEGDPRDADGKVTSGPEYLEVWDGLTGKTIARAPWPSRDGFEKRGHAYNDYSRNQLAIAYLDGKTPCMVALRGTYGLMKAEAWQLDNGRMASLWKYSSADYPREWQGQGAHNTRVGDLDGDGRDEIVLGSAALDDDGKPLWTTGKGHPDYLYLTEIVPGKLAVVAVLETRQKVNGGVTVADAATGKILWQHQGPTAHVHTGFAGDFDPRQPGLESGGTDTGGGHQIVGDNGWLYSAAGKMLLRGKENPFFGKTPHFVYWDADLQREIVRPQPEKYRGGDAGGRIEGSYLMHADLYGDWREEILTVLPGELRVYSTTVPAMDRRTTLMADPFYRQGVTVAAQGYYYDPMTRKLLYGEAPNCNLTWRQKQQQLEVVCSAPRTAGVNGVLRLARSGMVFEPAELKVDLAPGEQRLFTVNISGDDGSGEPIHAVWTLDDGRKLRLETPGGRYVAPPPKLRGIVTEAETFIGEQGGAVQRRTDKNGVSGQALSHWDKTGHALTWKLEVPGSGRYRLLLRYCSDARAMRELRIDGKKELDIALAPSGGLGDSPGDWREWVSPQALELSAGTHELTLVNSDGQSVNLDLISLLP